VGAGPTNTLGVPHDPTVVAVERLPTCRNVLVGVEAAVETTMGKGERSTGRWGGAWRWRSGGERRVVMKVLKRQDGGGVANEEAGAGGGLGAWGGGGSRCTQHMDVGTDPTPGRGCGVSGAPVSGLQWVQGEGPPRHASRAWPMGRKSDTPSELGASTASAKSAWARWAGRPRGLGGRPSNQSGFGLRGDQRQPSQGS
jgi:hypothetical protein